TPKHRLLIAQAAFQNGDIGVARDLATREKAATTTSELRARSEALLGLVERRQGNWNSARTLFQASLQAAIDSKHAVQIGWSSLWLFRTLAELGPAEQATGMLPEVRSAIARAGDSHLSAYM